MADVFLQAGTITKVNYSSAIETAFFNAAEAIPPDGFWLPRMMALHQVHYFAKVHSVEIIAKLNEKTGVSFDWKALIRIILVVLSGIPGLGIWVEIVKVIFSIFFSQ